MGKQMEHWESSDILHPDFIIENLIKSLTRIIIALCSIVNIDHVTILSRYTKRAAWDLVSGLLREPPQQKRMQHFRFSRFSR
jgi:hypothetical protein